MAEQPVRALALAQRWLRELTYTHLQWLLATSQESVEARFSTNLRPALRSRIRQAIRDEREHECPFAEPYYWATFVYYGA